MNLFQTLHKYITGHRWKTVLLFVLAICFFILLRFDITYSLPAYRIQKEDNLWTILNDAVFHEPSITSLSIQYLDKTSQSFNKNYLQANISTYIQDGDILNINSGKLSILRANHEYRIKNLAILPQTALINHAISVLYYDLLLSTLLIFFCLCIIKYRVIFNDLKKSDIVFFVSLPFVLCIIVFCSLVSFGFFYGLMRGKMYEIIFFAPIFLILLVIIAFIVLFYYIRSLKKSKNLK